MTLKELKILINEFEKDGKHCMGINLTKDIASGLRRELHNMYGIDPGESLTTLFGKEVLSFDAETLSFEE